MSDHIPFKRKKDTNYGIGKKFSKDTEIDYKQLQKEHEIAERKRRDDALKEIQQRVSGKNTYTMTESKKLRREDFLGYAAKRSGTNKKTQASIASEIKEMVDTGTIPLKKESMTLQPKVYDRASIINNQIICPKCKAMFEMDPEYIGQLAECSECSIEFIIPDLKKEAEEARKEADRQTSASMLIDELSKVSKKKKKQEKRFEWLE